MPANTSPIFPISQRFAAQIIKVANFAKDGTTAFGIQGTSPSFTTILAAGPNGTRIDQIKVRALGPNSTGVLRLFVNNGSVNRLVHETTLSGTSAASTRTVTNQTAGTNQFTTSAAHGYNIGDIVYFSVLSTLTAVTLNKAYYIASVPTTTTFTLMDETGTLVTVGTNVSAATATLVNMGNFEGAASTDFDVAISKNTTETAVPIPYLPNGYSLVATISTTGIILMGWAVSAFGADY
jgi:hypothetical protein